MIFMVAKGGVNEQQTMIKELLAAGWQLKRVRGSHHIFKHRTLPQTVVVPHPKKDLPPGTVLAIKRHAGLA